MGFDFSSDYVLENEAVLLRPLVVEDHKRLLYFAINEPELWRYSMVQAIGETGLSDYLQLALNGREEGKQYAFIVYDKRAKMYAGCTRFYDVQLSAKTLQLGYTWYGRQFQGTGLNRHCKYLLLQFAFEQMQFERVEFRADCENTRSITSMKAIGCVEEGILRSNGIRPDGSRRDSMVLSILRSEWFGNVKGLLSSKIN